MSSMIVKNRKNKISVEVEYTFPNTLEEAVEKYGEEVVLNRFIRQINQELRALVIRKAIEAKEAKGDVEAAAKEAAESFEPSLPRSGAAKAAKTIQKALSGMSEEEAALVLQAILGKGAIANGAAESSEFDPLASQ